ncbi:MAG: glycosyltransferase [Chitinophagaceae bacterium]
MNHHFPEKITGKPRILVAPLDWGLGHATRCIPLIRELLAQDAEVWLAGESAQEKILKSEFPLLPILPLKGYRIKYAGTAAGLVWQMFRQLPRMKQAIRDEHEWLRNASSRFQFDAVISDNRYGLYHPGIPSVIMTHQLLIKTGWGKISERILQEKNYRYINRFRMCWVPDEDGPASFAGELSHPARMPQIPVRYTGLLSRFSKGTVPVKKDHLLFLLSGPEPQRGILEKIFREQVVNYPGKAVLVRGLPGADEVLQGTGEFRVFNHLDTQSLGREMQEAEYVICRSGYSTVMDAMTLGKKCIFIPTPGQTEQEYLGRYLMEKGIAICVSQKNFSLPRALEQATGFNYRIPETRTGSELTAVIRAFLDQATGVALG